MRLYNAVARNVSVLIRKRAHTRSRFPPRNIAHAFFIRNYVF